MTGQLIPPDELPLWAPGRLTVQSPASGWDAISVRGYGYSGSDVELPPLRDYLIVAYHRGGTEMRREVDGCWTTQEVRPGDVSLLTRAEMSHWVWPDDIEVVHVYLTEGELASTCRQMYERDIHEIELHDVVRAEDPTIFRSAMLIASEAAKGGVGSRLVVDALACELSVNILRRHANVRFQEEAGPGGLAPGQVHVLNEFIRENLDGDLSLQQLADTIGLSRFHFARAFKQTTGVTVHEHVTALRIERAKVLLRRTREPLSVIAARCGFSDQSHFTRVFRKRVDVTPGQFRG